MLSDYPLIQGIVASMSRIYIGIRVSGTPLRAALCRIPPSLLEEAFFRHPFSQYTCELRYPA